MEDRHSLFFRECLFILLKKDSDNFHDKIKHVQFKRYNGSDVFMKLFFHITIVQSSYNSHEQLNRINKNLPTDFLSKKKE